MSSLKRTMTFAAYEPGAQGPWPKEKYEELYSIQAQILNAMAMFAGALARLEPTWCSLLARNSNMMHPAFVRTRFGYFPRSCPGTYSTRSYRRVLQYILYVGSR
jgi:hypothetical protein